MRMLTASLFVTEKIGITKRLLIETERNKLRHSPLQESFAATKVANPQLPTWNDGSAILSENAVRYYFSLENRCVYRTTCASKKMPGKSFIKLLTVGPGWCGSADWVPACKPKGRRFDSQSGHMPGLRTRSPVGGTWEATAHPCFSPSLSLSLPLSVKINKIFFLIVNNCYLNDTITGNLFFAAYFVFANYLK